MLPVLGQYAGLGGLQNDSPEGHGNAAPAWSARQFKAEWRGTFFLASGSRHDEVPALGRECASEAEAIIDAFRERVNFYRVSEFQTRADVGPSGGTHFTEGCTKEE